MTSSPRERRAGPLDVAATRLLDVTLAVILAVISLPVAVMVAVAVKLDSPGPVFFRCPRIGSGGRPFGMLKFRKMYDGARGPGLTATEDDRFTRVGRVLARSKLDSPGPVFFRCPRIGSGGRPFGMLKFRKMYDGARGPGLTATEDDRFTRVGRVLARSKLDELPQLWNVLRGEMSLVGPRPEDPSFVATRPDDFALVLSVRPGITGLSQLAFANESAILDPDDRVNDYLDRILPQKMGLDALYAYRRSLAMDIRILSWTVVAVVLRRDVAVHRGSGRTTLRRRPEPSIVPVGSPAPARVHVRQ